MIVYILLCDSTVPTVGGMVETKKVFLNAYSSMFTAQRAIAEYYLPPNLIRLQHREEEELRYKHAICNQVYTDRSRNSTYHFYVVQIDLDKTKDD